MLHLAALAGTGISLGRFQRPDAVAAGRDRPLIRRLTGGRAAAYGDGLVSVSLVLPDPSALLAAERIPVSKVLNRYVRGILAGLEALGVEALYYGTDFIAVNRRHGGTLTAEVSRDGTVLMQAILAIEVPALLPHTLLAGAAPQATREPPPTTLAEAVGRPVMMPEVIEALMTGFSRKFGVTFEPGGLSVPGPAGWPGDKAAAPLPDLNLALPPHASRPCPIAGGFLQAHVAIDDDRIQVVRFTGELVADSPAIEELEQRLAGRPIERAAIEAEVGVIFNDPRHVLMGVKSLRIFADAVLNAAASGQS